MHKIDVELIRVQIQQHKKGDRKHMPKTSKLRCDRCKRKCHKKLTTERLKKLKTKSKFLM